MYRHVKPSITAATTMLYLGWINFIGLNRTSIEHTIYFANNTSRKKMNLQMMKKGCCTKYLRKSMLIIFEWQRQFLEIRVCQKSELYKVHQKFWRGASKFARVCGMPFLQDPTFSNQGHSVKNFLSASDNKTLY